MREVNSNGSGFFSFPALLPGTYDVTIASQGFKAWKQRGITLANAENRSLPNVQLQVGTPSETVIINHANKQFGLTNDVSLTFSGLGSANTNTTTDGRPHYEVGRRVIELAVKYNF
jgi:hypothetical protein